MRSKRWNALIVGMFVLSFGSLIPILYCALFDYATGDDLGKSANVHRVIINGGSIIDVVFQAIKDSIEVWYTHEGTWASNFILALQPGIWGENFYALTPFIGLAFLLVGIGCFIYEITVNVLGYSKIFFCFLFSLSTVLMTQYMPFIRGGLFWYTGMAHYTIPFGVSLFLLTINLVVYRTNNKKLIPVMVLFSIYIGGSHYQAMLLVLLYQVLLAYIYYTKNNKNMPVVLIQIVIELIGLTLCAIAPGNSQRAGDNFSFSISKAIFTVMQSIKEGSYDGIRYFLSIKLFTVFFFIVVAFAIYIGSKKAFLKKHPIIVIYSFLVYCATYSPGVYYSTYDAQEGISGGFYDFSYFTFVIFITFFAVFIGESIAARFDKTNTSKLVILLGVISLIIFGLEGKNIIKDSADYMIYRFIREGHLRDYDQQMKERLEILLDETVTEVVLPEMNSEQGPFMHMAITDDVNNFTNYVTKDYYNKNTVIAIPREKYYELYGK